MSIPLKHRSAECVNDKYWLQWQAKTKTTTKTSKDYIEHKDGYKRLHRWTTTLEKSDYNNEQRNQQKQEGKRDDEDQE